MAGGIALAMITGTKDFGDLTVAFPSLVAAPSTKTSKEPILIDGNPLSLTYAKLVAEEWVVSTPKLRVKLIGPIGKHSCLLMLDTGAECNILPLSIAKNLGCSIFSIDDFQLSTVSGSAIGFAGIARMRVEVKEGFGCDTAFFLLDGAPKILLGQPFGQKMKLNFDHRSDGSWDAIFVDPDDLTSRCTTMVVPPLLKGAQSKPRRQVSFQPSVEDDSDEQQEN